MVVDWKTVVVRLAAIIMVMSASGCGESELAKNDDGLLVDEPLSSESGETPTMMATGGEAPQLLPGPPMLVNDENSEVNQACDAEPDVPVVLRHIYHDRDESDRSAYTDGPGDGDEWASVDIDILGADPASYTVHDCGDGRRAITGLGEGPYLIRPKLDNSTRCTTANCPSRFADAIIEGRTPDVLIAGDSICVIGPQPLFPERLRTLFAGLTDLNIINVCKTGSTSPQWKPGTSFFRQSIVPHVGDADLLIVSLGGNDVLQFVGNYVQSVGVPSDIEGAVNMAKGVVEGIVSNLRQMIVEVRKLNPNVDIVYLLYMDYSRAENHRFWGLVGGFLGQDAVAQVLEVARNAFPKDIPRLMLVDLFGRSDELEVIDYLYDELHMNDRGHTLYAEEIFQTLGGVRRGDSMIGGEGRGNLGVESRFGFAPLNP